VSEQFKAALIRGVIISLITAGATLFASLADTSSWSSAFIAAGAAFFSAMAVRVGGEGAYDTNRNARGDVRAGDVGAAAAAATPATPATP
jgi:hypothetical protein